MTNIIYTKWQSPLSEEAIFFTMMNETEGWSVSVSNAHIVSIELKPFIGYSSKIGSENVLMSNEQEFKEAYLKVFSKITLKL